MDEIECAILCMYKYQIGMNVCICVYMCVYVDRIDLGSETLTRIRMEMDFGCMAVVGEDQSGMVALHL